MKWLLLIAWMGVEFTEMPPPHDTFAQCRAAGEAHVYYGHGAPIVWKCVRVHG